MKKFFQLILLLIANGVAAQNRFDRIDTIPVFENSVALKNPWAGGINFPNINSIDLNNDGLKDLFLFDRHNNRIETFLNNGNTDYSLAWDYAPQYATQFPPITKWALCYDYNCDGKEDLFTLSDLQNGIKAYRNDGSAGLLQWTLVKESIKELFDTNLINVFASGVSLPAFADVDRDGDMDILGYNSIPDGRVAWHTNRSMETYGNCDSLNFAFSSGCWGDFTLRIGGSNSVGCFQCPCRIGTVHHPFIEPSYDQSEATKRDDTISAIFPIDIDGDSDFDLLVGDIASTNSLLIVNGGSTVTANMVTQDIAFPSADIPAEFNGFHYHGYIDVDNDGVRDLLVYADEFENKHGIWLYKNNGTDAVPVFNLVTRDFLQNTMIEAGENVTATLADYDADGLQDLFVGGSVFIDSTGTYRCFLRIYKNTGNLNAPSFNLIEDDFLNLSQVNYSFIAPAFGDIDGDGDQDLIVGNNDGLLSLYTNTAGAGNTMNLILTSSQAFSIDVGLFSAPQLFDLDKDGALDLLIGEKNGFVNYFRNTGTSTNPVFAMPPDNDTLGCIVRQPPLNIDGYTVPFAFDSLGKTRLIVSDMTGIVDQYIDINGNISGCYTNAGRVFPPESNRLKFDVSVTGGDLNNDGFTDLITGISTGGLQVYYQYNPTASVPTLNGVNPSAVIFPNPATSGITFRFFNLKSTGNVIRICDAIGKIVFEKEIETNEITLSTVNWSAGMYFVRLISEGRSSVSRFSVAR
jgi:hypothetical protein